MIVTFSSKAHHDVIMFDIIARRLIEMMGRRGEFPGALAPEDIGEARARLIENLQTQSEEQVDASVDADEQSEPLVSLRTRAVPLIELLDKAQAEGAHVMWDT